MLKRNHKSGLSRPSSSKKARKILPMPSKIGCGECFINMKNESYNNSIINESLSSKDKIANYDIQLYNFERIQNNAIPNHVINLKKLRQIEVEKLEHIEVAENKKRIKLQEEEDEFKKLAEKTTFYGTKVDFVKKAAHYYFNENNPFGVHLSDKQIPHIARMLCEYFKAEDGSVLTERTTREGLRQGFNMDAKGEISIK